MHKTRWVAAAVVVGMVGGYGCAAKQKEQAARQDLAGPRPVSVPAPPPQSSQVDLDTTATQAATGAGLPSIAQQGQAEVREKEESDQYQSQQDDVELEAMPVQSLSSPASTLPTSSSPSPPAAMRLRAEGREAKLSSLGYVAAESAPGMPQRPDILPPNPEAPRLPEPMPCIYIVRPPENTERYAAIDENDFAPVGMKPLSTFSTDVDTGSYSNVRRFLTGGQLPPADAVRVEEMINYFDYAYAPPQDEHPFAVHLAVMQCPWAPAHRLVRVGLKGKEINADQRPASNLVFLIDVSGSMQSEDKLPLLKRGMQMLVKQLNGNDTVSIVTYAGNSGIALQPTQATEDGKRTIDRTLESLESGGSTHGSAGIRDAYEIAKHQFIKGGTNRVILCSDGDFNVGTTSLEELTGLIEEKAKTGVFLTVLGFGEGNLKDETMEQLADKGNGLYGYIDNITEARKMLVGQMTGSLITIAKDVKIQVEFNPGKAQAWRLIGYENRLLADQDFNDDRKDAGEIGAGHTVTALYEVVPVGTPMPQGASVDPLKYQAAGAATPAVPSLELTAAAQSNELMTVKLRYKQPEASTSTLMTAAVQDADIAEPAADPEARFAAAVAAFGMHLRHSEYVKDFPYERVVQLAQGAKGLDTEGYRAEFLTLVRNAAEMGG